MTVVQVVNTFWSLKHEYIWIHRNTTCSRGNQMVLKKAFQIKIHLNLCLSSEERIFLHGGFTALINVANDKHVCWAHDCNILHNLQCLESMLLAKNQSQSTDIGQSESEKIMSFIHPPFVSFYFWTQNKIFWSCYRHSVLLTKQYIYILYIYADFVNGKWKSSDAKASKDGWHFSLKWAFLSGYHV